MACSVWIALLFPVLVRSQSGEYPADPTEPRIVCTSKISIFNNNLTCQLDDTDNDDDEVEDVNTMTLCFNGKQCITEKGNKVKFANLKIMSIYNLTIQLNSGGIFWKEINLKRIVKPTRPFVENATFLSSSNRVVINIGDPYKNDYLENNQLFQLRIWSAKNDLVRNITYLNVFIDGDEYFHKNTEYHVKVRAKPNGKYFAGFWSEWSPSLSFRTDKEADVQMLPYSLIVLTVAVLLGTLTISIFWRKEIQSFIWPSIPHPKHTLIHSGKPLKGLLVSFNPEVFSDLNIQLVEPEKEQDFTAQPPDADTHPLAEVKGQLLLQECSGDTTSCRSISSGESDSTLLRCDSPEERSDLGAGCSGSSDFTVGILDLRSDTDSVETDDSNGNMGADRLGPTQQGGKDEAYVTMSSFYSVREGPTHGRTD
ncbi:hypothetical protein UPYG_G00284520 [Umbra pygmaea]|uniref:Interleukin-7 receptor subunit alpha n=1 Tax=Umbra pygmaea TaxID=75934 RepID=A0ABD0WPU1_UMBPY